LEGHIVQKQQTFHDKIVKTTLTDMVAKSACSYKHILLIHRFYYLKLEKN